MYVERSNSYVMETKVLRQSHLLGLGYDPERYKGQTLSSFQLYFIDSVLNLGRCLEMCKGHPLLGLDFLCKH